MDKLTKEEGLLILDLVISPKKEVQQMKDFYLFQNQGDQEYLDNKLKLLIDIYNKDFYPHK